MKKRYRLHRWVVEKEAPVRRWTVLGLLLAFPVALSLTEAPRELTGPEPEPRDVASVLGTGSGCDVPTNPISNCGFESGDFSDWGTQDLNTPFVPLTVDGAELTPQCVDQNQQPVDCGFFLSDPTEGSLAALHGWDGDGPGLISIFQDFVSVPVNGPPPVLTFDFRAAFDLTFGATMDRTFTVSIEPDGGGPPLLGPIVMLTAPFGTTNFDTGDQVGQVDLAGLEGQKVRVRFDWVVERDFTGPGFFQLDNIQITTATCGDSVLQSCNCNNFGSGQGCDPLLGGDQACEDFVCGFDPFCCIGTWDFICNDGALESCACTVNEDCEDGNTVDGDCCGSSCAQLGDLNNSDRVDGNDLAPLAQALGSTSGFPPEADLVPDGMIDGMDLNELIDFFGCDFTPVPAP